jgi:menaquinone-dependent protoporphyrinogen oxidase
MKTLIVFASGNGTTERCANLLAEKVTAPKEVVNLKKGFPANPEDYDTIIIGGSILAGKIQSVVRKFINRNCEILMKKRVGLFICCMAEEESERDKYFTTSFPQDLRDHAFAKGFFGGEVIFSGLNLLSRFIMKKITKTDQDIHKINQDAIARFAETIDKSL